MINKRLYRAREKLRSEKIQPGLPEAGELETRLDSVLTTLYLLFSEGYFSESQKQAIRKDLCLEAMRLCTMLVENEATNKPRVNALLALMCFHASRLDARQHPGGGIVLYNDQDIALWNDELIARGAYFMRASAKGEALSSYHLEAGIAWWHTKKDDTPEKWENILQLYNSLLQLSYSPMAALNRIYALAKVEGKAQAIAEAELLNLRDNVFYDALLGELYTGINTELAIQHFEKALLLTKIEVHRDVLKNKIKLLQDGL